MSARAAMGEGAEPQTGMDSTADTTPQPGTTPRPDADLKADVHPQPDPELVAALSAGQVVVLGTDTVYGLAAVPTPAAVETICALKLRPRSQALAWLVPDADEAFSCWAAEPGAAARKLAARLWPGALTLVVKASLPARAIGCCADDGTLALRVPDDDALRALMRAIDAPLACTSANIHGMPAPARRTDIEPGFLLLPGAACLPEECPGAVPSTIVDCTGESLRIVRSGAIPEGAIMEAAAGA